MKKYILKLEKLLKIKEHNEQIAKEKYAAELQKKLKLEIENKKINEEMYQSSLDDYKSFVKGETISFDRICLQEQYISGLKLKIQENDRKKERLEPLFQKLKEELTRAMRERKTLDKLKEKDYIKYKDEHKKYEIKILDDIAGQRQLSRRRIDL